MLVATQFFFCFCFKPLFCAYITMKVVVSGVHCCLGPAHFQYKDKQYFQNVIVNVLQKKVSH